MKNFTDGEYCAIEDFSPLCVNNDVILMFHARYGRMHMGECLTEDRNIGCGTDVIGYFDRHCSGKTQCDATQDWIPPENEDCSGMPGYLDAAYECVPGKLDSELFITFTWK